MRSRGGSGHALVALHVSVVTDEAVLRYSSRSNHLHLQDTGAPLITHRPDIDTISHAPMNPPSLVLPSLPSDPPPVPIPPLRPSPPLAELLAASLPTNPPPPWLPHSLRSLYLRLSHLPIVEFYQFLYRTSPLLFASTLFTNWLLPVVLEALPWYLSRRALSKLLRDSKNAIQHRLINADPFPPSTLFAFASMSLMYSLLHTVEDLLRTRLLLLNRLVIRRLVMERILYSEVGSLQERYASMFGGEKSVLRTEQLEVLVFNDIHETLLLFNSTLPSIFRSTYTLLLSTADLWAQRKSIDVLSILRPSLVGFTSEALNLLRDRVLLDPQTVALQRVANESSRLISNIVDGLSEIQCNNMQDWAMQRLNALSGEEVTGKQGWTTWTSNMYRVVQGRGVFDFVSEVYVVKAVMERRGISHEEYRKVQNDIDYTSRLVGRIYSLVRDSWRIVDTQQRVMAVLHLPTFIQERRHTRTRRRHHQTKPLSLISPSPSRPPPSPLSEEFDFHDLTVHRLWFRYGPNLPWALKIGPRPFGIVESDDTTEAVQVVDLRGGRKEDDRVQQGSDGVEEVVDCKGGVREPVLRFERGKTYAIIGQNRSGKSTLMEILCKLHPTDPSTLPLIAVNASLPSHLSAASSFTSLPRIAFRSVLSYIPQRPFIFPGTIEDNVRMGDTSATARQVEVAAEAAGLFLYDKETEGKGADEAVARPTELAVEWKGDIQRKPWEADRLGETVRKLWGWAVTAWASQWWQEGEELDEEDEEVWGKDFHMEDAVTTTTRPSISRNRPAREVSAITAASPSSPSLLLPPPLSPPSSPAVFHSPVHSSSSSTSSVPPSRHPVLSLECAEGGSNLSGGFAQSVALSRVFLRPSSQLVILDEAMGAMDPIKKVEWIVPHLMEWVRERGQCLLVVTHDVRLICPLVDCVYVMEHGRLVLSGSHAGLMERRAQPYQRMFGEA